MLDDTGYGPSFRRRGSGNVLTHTVMAARAAFQQAKADHGFTGQELELKLDTQLTRKIGRLATELHNRYTR